MTDAVRSVKIAVVKIELRSTPGAGPLDRRRAAPACSLQAHWEIAAHDARGVRRLPFGGEILELTSFMADNLE
jgi:hypothetical protein